MATVVWKYELDLVDEPQLRPMPRGAAIVHVASQADRPCLWASVDPSRTIVDRWFTVVGTGHPIPDGAEYVGTAQTHAGALVWHVHETSS